ncbi:hypothetical protein CPLU01_02113 [Colletotrichum plurivorum]|uniref:Uncharacterized protein n=1 Tax=Colletotrichum plurivorum TaxID=2175906 RepID=A0A8H6KWS7_9PEZI|nr:hypothetical protein CPLU01_02113 [Colletotrichum plurivorum]
MPSLASPAARILAEMVDLEPPLRVLAARGSTSCAEWQQPRVHEPHTIVVTVMNVRQTLRVCVNDTNPWPTGSLGVTPVVVRITTHPHEHPARRLAE